MSNENETPKPSQTPVTESSARSDSGRCLLPHDEDEHPWAAEARLDRTLSEGMRPSRPHD